MYQLHPDEWLLDKRVSDIQADFISVACFSVLLCLVALLFFMVALGSGSEQQAAAGLLMVRLAALGGVVLLVSLLGMLVMGVWGKPIVRGARARSRWGITADAECIQIWVSYSDTLKTEASSKLAALDRLPSSGRLGRRLGIFRRKLAAAIRDCEKSESRIHRKCARLRSPSLGELDKPLLRLDFLLAPLRAPGIYEFLSPSKSWVAITPLSPEEHYADLVRAWRDRTLRELQDGSGWWLEKSLTEIPASGPVRPQDLALWGVLNHKKTALPEDGQMLVRHARRSDILREFSVFQRKLLRALR